MKATRKSQPRTVAHNPLTGRVETVYPEDEVPVDRRIPMFWSQSLHRWVTIPD